MHTFDVVGTTEHMRNLCTRMGGAKCRLASRATACYSGRLGRTRSSPGLLQVVCSQAHPTQPLKTPGATHGAPASPRQRRRCHHRL
jgi:hypothetical protein